MLIKHQKEETATRLKQVYSDVNQAVVLAQKDFGTIENWDISHLETPQERIEYFTNNFLVPNLKVMKVCLPTTSECWAKEVKSIDGIVTGYSGDNDSSEIPKASLLTVSGYSIYYWLHNPSGSGGWFWVDINGPNKGPNKIGRDIFNFTFNWGPNGTGFKPGGLNYIPVPTRDEIINGRSENFPNNCACRKGTNDQSAGRFCGALISLDGWQIKDDYPW